MRFSFLGLLFAIAGAAAAQTASLEPEPSRRVSDHLGGGGKAYSIRSAILGEQRPISVATPESFPSTGSDRRYPVILVLDGEFNFAPTVAAARYLSRAGQIPEAIVVGVENTDRLRDLTPPGLSVSGSSQNEGGDRFLDFLERELLSALAKQFRAGALVVLIGHSSGGILASYSGATRPGSFPFVVALDTPAHLQGGWLKNVFAGAMKKEPAHPLRYVSLESGFGWPEPAWKELLSARPAQWDLWRDQVAGESHQSMVFLGTYLGLRRLFADYSMLTAPQAPPRAALEHYRKLPAAYPGPLVPPRALLERVLEDFLIAGDAAQAQAALDALILGYGESARAEAMRARITEAAKRPPPGETVEDLLNTPRPDPPQMAPFLGEWNGYMQSGDAPRQPVRLRIEIHDGIVTGSFINWPAPEMEQSMPVQYFKVTADGLHFGYLNRMRPRGMLVYEMVWHGQILEGEMKLRGVNFQPPGGRALPTVRITLERAAQ